MSRTTSSPRRAATTLLIASAFLVPPVLWGQAQEIDAEYTAKIKEHLQDERIDRKSVV